MAQTLIEKIVQNHAVGLEPDHIVQSGDFISIEPRLVGLRFTIVGVNAGKL